MYISVLGWGGMGWGGGGLGRWEMVRGMGRVGGWGEIAIQCRCWVGKGGYHNGEREGVVELAKEIKIKVAPGNETSA